DHHSTYLCFFLQTTRPHPRSTLFPYTTLFRSWTSGTLYDWMKTKIGGVDILPNSGSFCCESFGGKTFVAVGAENDFNRDFDQKRSEEHTSELQSRGHLVCRLLLEKKKNKTTTD